MTAALYKTITSIGTCVNLSNRAKWRLSGSDRIRYLNGQVTNDVRTAKDTAALYACVTNLKGRIEAGIFIHAAPDGESLLLDADASLRDNLGMRLEKYIIADDAVLEDVTDEWQLWHLLGSQQPLEAGHALANDLRFGLPGTDVWLPTGTDVSSLSTLSAEEAETLRILQKVPAYPSELNADTFPQEAGLEGTTMSYTKGCYIGQEILSRIKTTGKMPRQLIAWSSDANLAVDEVIVNDEGKEVGRITSVAWHPVKEAFVGLGYVKQASADGVLKTVAGGLQVG
jgi:folate-binding protein YgfZ